MLFKIKEKWYNKLDTTIRRSQKDDTIHTAKGKTNGVHWCDAPHDGRRAQESRRNLHHPERAEHRAGSPGTAQKDSGRASDSLWLAHSPWSRGRFPGWGRNVVQFPSPCPLLSVNSKGTPARLLLIQPGFSLFYVVTNLKDGYYLDIDFNMWNDIINCGSKRWKN